MARKRLSSIRSLCVSSLDSGVSWPGDQRASPKSLCSIDAYVVHSMICPGLHCGVIPVTSVHSTGEAKVSRKLRCKLRPVGARLRQVG